MRTRPPARHLILTLLLMGAAHTHAAERIVIDGSTGMMPLVAALAAAYRAKDPAATIDIGKGLGTKARIQALNDGKIDIAMASHGLDVAQIQRQGMVVHEIAKVAVVFGVNAGVIIANLSDAQVCDLYSSKLRNWKELGGSDLAVVPMTRPDSEVDTEVVRHKIPCLATLKMPDAVKVMPKAGEMAQALSATTGAFGMTTMTVVEQSQGRVRAVSLGGIVPSAENVQSKRYLLTRDSFLVVKTPPSPATARFIDFVLSPAGAKVIAANGAVPVK
jgi:phosphate transport system substrate-binding protein